MRQDTIAFAEKNEAATKTPRFVVAIMFDVGSVYVTSHGDISGLPGTPVSNALLRPSSVSQRIRPDEGRAEIGSFTFDLVDRGEAFTAAIRNKLQSDAEGIRGRTVQFFVGYTTAWSDFQLVQTQTVDDVNYSDGVYSVRCRDIQRATRADIFEPKATTLRDTVTATDTSIPVYDTSAFVRVVHGASYSDAPASTVGYIKIENEIIRYTGSTADTFTGCTRGALNTRAVAHAIDANTDAARRTKVLEVIYLELPAPKLAYAILTGDLEGDSATLPAHWNLGIDPSLVRLADFTGIGPDLWDQATDAAGLILRFIEPKRTDGKRFLEVELLQIMACYAPVYTDGSLGLRRLAPVLRDAAAAFVIDESVAVNVGALGHDLGSTFNRARIDWNWDGKDYTRSTALVDAASVAIHGSTPLKTLKYAGLYGARHTDAVIAGRLAALRDRYTAPPETLTVSVLPSANRLEVGDLVRVKLPNVRDYAGPAGPIDRTFEIQAVTVDWSDGLVELSLFGSTDRVKAAPLTSPTSALADSFYTATGTALSSVVTIAAGVVQAGTYTVNGSADMTAAASVFYFDGDLTIPQGATINLTGNVQLRVRGYLTVNGEINGVGGGKPGVAFPVMTYTDQEPLGTPGYIGNTRGGDGLHLVNLRSSINHLRNRAIRTTVGEHGSFPYLGLETNETGTTLDGLPLDLRGTSGGAGGLVWRGTTGQAAQFQVSGGDGAASGAGLVLICRGLGFGASGLLDLSGADAAAGAYYDWPGTNHESYSGSGGAGGPGAFLCILDGSGISLPDLSGGKFVATTGLVPVNGTPVPDGGNTMQDSFWIELNHPYTGHAGQIMSLVDYSTAAHRIQYLSAGEAAIEDVPNRPPAPTSIAASGQIGFNLVTVAPPAFDTFDALEIWASVDNVRGNATKAGEGKFDTFAHTLPGGATRFYWTRTRREETTGPIWSAWQPDATTTSATATATSPSAGPAGDSIEVEYSIDGSTAWHSTFTTGDIYMRQRVGTGGTWSAAIRIVGEQGTPGGAGNFIDSIFRRASSQPATPTGDNPVDGVNWFDAPPAANGNPLWFSQGEKTAGGSLVGVWSTPVQIEGAAGYGGALSNDSTVLPADSAGTVLDYSTAGGMFRVYLGGLEVTASATFAVTVQQGCQGTINTADNTPINGQSRGYYRVTLLSASSGYLRMTATHGGVVLTRDFVLAKAPAGASAALVRLSSTADAFTYNAAGAADPGGQVITFLANRQNVSQAAQWSTTPTVTLSGTGDTRQLAIADFGANASVQVTVTADGLSDTKTVFRLQQGQQGLPGSPGYNAATLIAFKRAASAPTDNPGTLTYTFATGAWTPGNSWQKSIPTGTLPIWAKSATAFSNAATDQVDAADWTTPAAQIGSDGANGLNVATVYAYQRTTADSAPAEPTGTQTYTFATGGLSGLVAPWYSTPPAFTGANPYLWITTATASSSSSTDTIDGTGGEWAAPQKLAQNGQDATLLKITPTGQIFTFDGLGAANPTSQTITLDAILANVSGSVTWLCTRYNSAGASLGTVTLGGSGNTGRTLTVAQFSTAAYAKITATLGALSDAVLIVRVTDGASGLTSSISNPTFTVACNSAGTPKTGAFNGANGQVSVFAGGTNVTESCNFTAVQSSVTGSVSNTAGTKGAYSVTQLTAATGYLEITATYGSVSAVLRFTLSKSLDGAASSSATDDTLSSVTSTSYPASTADVVSLAVGPGGVISISGGGYYKRSTDSLYVNLACKVQWRESGGTWADVQAETVSTVPAYWVQNDFYWEPGEIWINTSMAGPSTAKIYEFRWLSRVQDGAITAVWIIGGGQFTVSWAP